MAPIGERRRDTRAAMPAIRIHLDGHERRVPAASSSLVGRHWSCIAVLGARRVPLYWLELRWLGSTWGWRALATNDRTRGSGALLTDGWRTLAPGARVRWDDDAWIQLEGEGPPALTLHDEATGEVLVGEALDALLEVREGKVLPLDADGAADADLPDGAVVSDGRRSWRLLRPETVASTDTLGFAVTHPELHLDLDLAALELTLTVPSRSVTVRGAAVRAVAPYALARRDGPRDDGGWLTLREAWIWWCDLGGRLTSAPDRLGWERGKVRTALAREGVRELDHLFETRRTVEGAVTRIGVAPERIHVSK